MIGIMRGYFPVLISFFSDRPKALVSVREMRSMSVKATCGWTSDIRIMIAIYYSRVDAVPVSFSQQRISNSISHIQFLCGRDVSCI